MLIGLTRLWALAGGTLYQRLSLARDDVGVASRANKMAALRFTKAQPAVADVPGFTVVRDQLTFDGDILLQSTAWAGQKFAVICKEPERCGVRSQLTELFAHLCKL